jgi:hypothetical protein
VPAAIINGWNHTERDGRFPATSHVMLASPLPSPMAGAPCGSSHRKGAALSSYQITRVRKGMPASPHGHQHVSAVEINEQPRMVEEITVLIRQGDVDFHTLSPSTGKRSAVHPWTCCGVRTLRSDIDSAPDNNLDNLPEF